MHELEIINKFLDPDITSFFEEKVKDSDGTEYPRAYFISSPALVASNLQLIKVLKEAFSRGFVVKK